MFKNISLDEALEYESESLITLFDYSSDYPDTLLHDNHINWVDNYREMLYKFRQYSPDQVSKMINSDYRIEIEMPYEPKTNTFTWKYLYGKITADLKKYKQFHSKGKFVYVLTNPAFDFVKIGKAVNPQKRIEQINNAGVVSEWKLSYALPVENDYMIENSVHRYLSEFRRGTDQGSSREFFDVTLEKAIKTIEMLAKDLKRGEPTYY